MSKFDDDIAIIRGNTSSSNIGTTVRTAIADALEESTSIAQTYANNAKNYVDGKASSIESSVASWIDSTRGAINTDINNIERRVESRNLYIQMTPIGGNDYTAEFINPFLSHS